MIVVDPRAGHGPGIGGFRRDSEVGMALREGHPVYFAVFDPEPVEGQTMGAVVETIAQFIATVARRHRGRDPIVYGNCQGGWAVVLALSHCRRRAGLAILNGSPLSCLAGAAGVNPMRLAGGLAGGVWPAHWLADLGGGRFDGAWLVQNFENLRPEGVWQKYDTLWADPEREHERFLAFERWWNGFYFLGREEILATVRDLFVGNKLESGEVVVDGHCHADLRRVTTPLVIFSSYGDNITPPHQALAWLRASHASTTDLVAARQTVVYLLDRRVGHLGLFVSADVATRQHCAILHQVAAIQALAPGLYEMVLEGVDGETPSARFEPRALEDIAFDPRPTGFQGVQELSEQGDRLYATFVSPLMRLLASRDSARLMERVHPMRARRQWWSEQENPAMAALARASRGRAAGGDVGRGTRAQSVLPERKNGFRGRAPRTRGRAAMARHRRGSGLPAALRRRCGRCSGAGLRTHDDSNRNGMLLKALRASRQRRNISPILDLPQVPLGRPTLDWSQSPASISGIHDARRCRTLDRRRLEHSMNWLSQNWILVVLGVGALLLLLRRASSAGRGQHGVRNDAPANVGEGGAEAARSRKHGGHGGHGGC